MALGLLTSWEVDQFIEEVSIRPTLWLGKERLWVRRRFGEHQLAVKFISEQTLFRAYTKTLSTQTQQEAERYTEWLVTKFTSYGDRKRVEGVILSHLERWEGDRTKIEELAIEIMRPLLTESPTEHMEEEHQVEVQETVFSPLPVPQIVRLPQPVKRSRYLQNLLKGK